MQNARFIALLLFLEFVNAEIQFKTSDYFAAHQVRLHLTQASSIFVYSIPVQPIKNPTTAAMALSGYDFAPNAFLSFSIQLSYDADSFSYQIVFTKNKDTMIYLINYFLIEVGQAASYWIAVQTFSFTSTNPLGLNITEYHTFNSSLPINVDDKIKVIPLINSATLYAANNPNFYFNISWAEAQNKTADINIRLFRNYSQLVSGCLTIILIKEAFINQPRIAFYSKMQYSVSSDGLLLDVAAAKLFGLNYYYGPIIQPKCVIAFRSFLINGSSRQNLNFDISQSTIISSSSDKYQVDFAQLCIGQVSCPIQSQQFYPMIEDCQAACNIANCLTCSSSTSCLSCSSSYFINPIKRCSACIINCLTCNDAKSCIVCKLGYYYANNMCQQCALYCLNCTIHRCFSCAQGYTPNATNCVSCQVAMPRCLKCDNPSICITCIDTYVFYTNQRACVSCDSMMPNCLLCNWPNNCLACKSNFYLHSFYQCYPCSFKIPSCCGNYIANCAVCASNISCNNCKIGWYVNSNQTCTACTKNWPNCLNCDNATCSACLKGYFILNSSCLLCNSTIEHCSLCTNSSICQSCQSPFIFGDGKCIDCPIWPMNNLYYVDNINSSVCHNCSKLDSHCSSCSRDGICLSCQEMYYLQNRSCIQCNQFMQYCAGCRTGDRCEICQNGYVLNIYNYKQCLSCRGVLDNCLSCVMNIKKQTSLYSCSICSPEYYPQSGKCTSCNTSLTNCLQCLDAITCTLCYIDFLPSASGNCLSCDNFMNGCTKCQTPSKCSQCAKGYVIQGTYCTICSTLVKNCKFCISNKQFICQQCLQGYFIAQNLLCLNCSSKYQFCISCNQSSCNDCITSFFVNTDGLCVRCDSAIPHCSYCNNSMRCRACSENYVLDMHKNQCLSCQKLSNGCFTCIQLQASSTEIICKNCVQNYFPHVANNITTCIFCGDAIPNCKICISLTQCQQCLNTSFPNQGKCSLCILYFQNCQICSSISTCKKCIDGYTIDGNNRCIPCEWKNLGLSDAGNQLCLQCEFNNISMRCVKCNEKSYLQEGKCLVCSFVISNCLQCIGKISCIKCVEGYYLAQKSVACLQCKFQNCKNCSQNSCYACQDGYFLSNNQCFSCSSVIPNCAICSQNGCTFCLDGYYLNQSTCFSCSTISNDCVVCDGKAKCLVSTPYDEAGRNLKIAKGFAFVSISGIIMIIVALTVYLVKWRIAKREEEDSGSDTSRRMKDGEYYSKDVEIQRNLCLYCKLRKAQQIKLELLCDDCDQIQNRGHQHKILRAVGQQAKDCIIERSLQIESNCIEKNSPIERQQFFCNNHIEQSLKPSNILGQKVQPLKNTKSANSSNEKFSYPGQTTKAQTSQKRSRFYRQMF